MSSHTHQPVYNPNGGTRIKKYRGGWSRSINTMFVNRRAARDDCCAISCCGVLLADRNAHLLSGTVVNWKLRRLLYFWLPLGMFAVLAGLASLTDPGDPEAGIPPTANPLLGAAVLAVPLVGILLLCRTTSQRRQQREEILRKLYQHQHGGAEPPLEWTFGSMRDTGNASGCCCCYHNDAIYTLVAEGDNDESVLDDAEEELLPPDFCTCLWKTFSAVCCGVFCQSWLQCCGMCGIAQESYEIQQGGLVEGNMKKLLQMDFITFQPYREYYPGILALRAMGETKLSQHYQSLSKLSKLILYWFTIYLVVEAVLKIALGQGLHYLVLLATYGQALVLLYLVHWKWHKLTISIDAVIKYFAAGFVFSILMAQVVETLLMIIFGLIAAFLVVEEVQQDAGDTPIDFWVQDPQHLHDFLKKHLGEFTLFVLIFAFIVAALVEELTKYFGFWMTETPDLMQDEIIVDEDEEENNESTAPPPTPTDRSYRITIAMIAAASGFACSENVSYVFSRPSLHDQIATLIIRSLLPLHQVCAAIQSVGVIRRDIEGSRVSQLGRIVLPAILLHGAYDAFAIGYGIISVAEDDDYTFAPTAAPKYPPEAVTPPPLAFADLAKTLLMLFPIFGAGVAYYVIQAKAQHRRLRQMEVSSVVHDELSLVEETATTAGQLA